MEVEANVDVVSAMPSTNTHDRPVLAKFVASNPLKYEGYLELDDPYLSALDECNRRAWSAMGLNLINEARSLSEGRLTCTCKI